MKMGPGLFWGIILIILGISIIFRMFFDISVFRILIAFAIILFGIRVLIGKPNLFSKNNENQVIFGDKFIQADPLTNTEYNTIFGKSVYDFRKMGSLSPGRTKITANTIFGSTELILPDSIPVKIKAEAVFGSASMPNGNTVAFGSVLYNSPGSESASDFLYIEANVVFGNLVIKK
jgi:hypothetical protein